MARVVPEADTDRAEGFVERASQQPADACHGGFLVGEEFGAGAGRGDCGERGVEGEGARAGIEGGDGTDGLAVAGEVAGQAIAGEVTGGRTAERGIAPERGGGGSGVGVGGVAARAQELVRAQGAVGQAGDAIGEGAASVDPEVRRTGLGQGGGGWWVAGWGIAQGRQAVDRRVGECLAQPPKLRGAERVRFRRCLTPRVWRPSGCRWLQRVVQPMGVGAEDRY